MIRILHSVGTFLKRTENWIYPQVTAVPDTQGWVLCDKIANEEEFLLPQSRRICPPAWKTGFGLPRLFNAAARRMGHRDAWRRVRVFLSCPHIIHAHFGPRGWASLELKEQLGVPMFTSFYGHDAWTVPAREPEWNARYSKLFEAGDLFLVEGPALRQRLVHLGCPAEKVRVQRIGVDLTCLPFDQSRIFDELKVAMVGRFVEKKGLLDGLRACARARARGTALRVTIIGDVQPNDSAGEEIKRQLEACAKVPELAGRVHFTGFLPIKETRAVLQNHNVFLCPSKHGPHGDAEGGSPVALTEAMALGLACIGTRHCDIPEVIVDGKTGRLCEEGDTSAMANFLCQLHKDSGRLAQFSEAGRLHIENSFSLSRQLGRLKELYASLLDHGRARG